MGPAVIRPSSSHCLSGHFYHDFVLNLPLFLLLIIQGLAFGFIQVCFLDLPHHCKIPFAANISLQNSADLELTKLGLLVPDRDEAPANRFVSPSPCLEYEGAVERITGFHKQIRLEDDMNALYGGVPDGSLWQGNGSAASYLSSQLEVPVVLNKYELQTLVQWFTNSPPQTRACEQGWIFQSRSDIQSTFMSEFSLVCHNSSLKNALSSAFALGQLLLSPFVALADKLGRKFTFIILLLIHFSSILGMLSVHTFTALLGTVGLFAGSWVTLFLMVAILIAESTASVASRWSSVISCGIFYSLGVILAGLVCLLLTSWRQMMLLYLILFASSSISVVLLYHQPLSSENKDGKEKYTSGCQLVDNVIRSIYPEIQHHYHIEALVKNIFTTKNFRFVCAIIMFNWLALRSVYYSLSFNTQHLVATSLQSGFLFSGLTEVMHAHNYFKKKSNDFK